MICAGGPEVNKIVITFELSLERGGKHSKTEHYVFCHKEIKHSNHHF